MRRRAGPATRGPAREDEPPVIYLLAGEPPLPLPRGRDRNEPARIWDAGRLTVCVGWRPPGFGPPCARSYPLPHLLNHLLTGEGLDQAARVEPRVRGRRERRNPRRLFDQAAEIAPDLLPLDVEARVLVERLRAGPGRGPRSGSAPGSWPRSPRPRPPHCARTGHRDGTGKRSSNQTGPRGTAPLPVLYLF